MSARVTVNTQAVASPPPGPVIDTAQAFLVGQTQTGPAEPVRVFGLADYRATFGERSGGSAMYDAVTSAFKEGLGSAWIVRALGPSPVQASVTLGSAMLVKANSVGAYANGLTLDWDYSERKLTVGGVAYVGSTLALLNAALEEGGAGITVTGTMSTSDDADTLAGGTDDYSNAVVATELAKFDADLGTGAVCWPGKASTIASDLQAHCEAASRVGLLAGGAADSISTITSTAGGLSGENLVLLWPYVTVTTNSGDLTMEPLGLALGARARAHVESPGTSPIRDIYGRARWITGVVTDTTAAEWQALNGAGVSVVRTSNSVLRLYGWRSLSAPDGVANLQGAQFRDAINAIAVGCQQVADRFVGRTVDGRGLALGEFAGALTGLLDSYSGVFFAGTNDPGYTVDVGPGVNTTADLAAGMLSAAVGVRLAPSAEFVTITVTATDAAGAI